jgi:hypothetical protein
MGEQQLNTYIPRLGRPPKALCPKCQDEVNAGDRNPEDVQPREQPGWPCKEHRKEYVQAYQKRYRERQKIVRHIKANALNMAAWCSAPTPVGLELTEQARFELRPTIERLYETLTTEYAIDADKDRTLRYYIPDEALQWFDVVVGYSDEKWEQMLRGWEAQGYRRRTKAELIEGMSQVSKV